MHQENLAQLNSNNFIVLQKSSLEGTNACSSFSALRQSSPNLETFCRLKLFFCVVFGPFPLCLSACWSHRCFQFAWELFIFIFEIQNWNNLNIFHGLFSPAVTQQGWLGCCYIPAMFDDVRHDNYTLALLCLISATDFVSTVCDSASLLLVMKMICNVFFLQSVVLNPHISVLAKLF